MLCVVCGLVVGVSCRLVFAGCWLLFVFFVVSFVVSRLLFGVCRALFVFLLFVALCGDCCVLIVVCCLFVAC